MDVRVAELSRTVDAAELGRTIRNARVAAGLTQGQVAGDEVTSAYVSRIEDGQRRPKLDLLERMADRMGTTVLALLEDAEVGGRVRHMVALDHAELELRGGAPDKALARAVQLTAEMGPEAPPDLRRRCAILRAEALEATGDLSGAIAEFEKLVAVPWGSADWLRCLIALSRCWRESGDLELAVTVGREAEAKIQELGLHGLTESIQLSVTVASAYMFRGELDRALRICREAIERAEQVQSPIARASAYWNASLIEARKGDDQAALDLARTALTYFELGEDARNLARLRGHVADMQLELDPPDPRGALATLSQAEKELAWSAGSPLDRASQLQTRARAHLLLGDLSEASDALDQALDLIPPAATLSRAYALALRGQISMSGGLSASARSQFLQAVQILTAIGADREAAQLWFELGGLLKSVGEAEAALDAFERAAASAGLRPIVSPSIVTIPLTSQ